MKILVTGGAGYIGSHTVDKLLQMGLDVVVVDNLATGHKSSVPEDVPFYEIDIRDQVALSNVFDEHNIDAVVHFAAKSLVNESMNKPLDYFDNNTYGMISLLEVMNKYNVKKIVFSSSASTYGIPKNIPVKEEDEQNPINPYGLTKLQMEQIMHWADLAYDIKGVALRYFNVAGAKIDGSIGEDHNPETHLVPNILLAAQGKKDKIIIFGNDYNTPDGFNVRDYVHVVDLANAHYLAINYLMNENSSNYFNLGSKIGFSVKQMVDAAILETGIDIPNEIGPRRAGDPDSLVADSTKAQNILGWKPELTDVKTIIQTAWNWMQKHPDGYGDK
ncbi:MAG: UDP-glucose 4-epimerase GalE [Lactobacillaceae bacterium]|jgi:UDP-glucose 4-epimerase|nr:UDP-glucose 4-epimerase GalE [Lactobacillaceae bacterium]